MYRLYNRQADATLVPGNQKISPPLESIIQKKFDTEQNSLRKGTSLACPLPDRMNAITQKHIPCAVASIHEGHPKPLFLLAWGKRPLKRKSSKIGTDTTDVHRLTCLCQV